MPSYLNNAFTFLIERAHILFLIVSLLIILEGLLYAFFPEKVKRTISDCPIELLKLTGRFIALIGIILLFVYAKNFN